MFALVMLGATSAMDDARRTEAPDGRVRITPRFAVSIRNAAVLMTSKMVNEAGAMSSGPKNHGAETQAAIFARGLSGARPEIPTSFSALEAAARDKMSPEAWAYVAGGAGLEDTMSANRAAFERVRIAPRMLAGVATRDLSTNLFGLDMTAPLLAAPIGVLDMAHPEADLALSRAQPLGSVCQ